MYRNCKISNDLSLQKTGDIICPVDLDTVMSGLFFSGLGDMTRTMCCTADENSTDWNDIAINATYYEEVMAAYRSSTESLFNAAEENYLPYTGLC